MTQHRKHVFKESLEKEHGDFLDKYFSQWFTIEKVSIEFQKWGLDRIFRQKKTGQYISVEYKAETRSYDIPHPTKKAFIEIFSNLEKKKPGWAEYCLSQFLNPNHRNVLLRQRWCGTLGKDG